MAHVCGRINGILTKMTAILIEVGACCLSSRIYIKSESYIIALAKTCL